MKKKKLKKKKLKKRLRKLENQYYRVLAQTRINMNDISHLKDLRKNMEETINHLNKLMADIKEKEFKDGN